MTVSAKEAFKRADKSTGFRDAVIVADEPCKISFIDDVGHNGTTETDGVASPLKKITKLFCSPDVSIPPGCVIAVTHKGETVNYHCSSKPSIFTNHQEIILEVVDKWA